MGRLILSGGTPVVSQRALSQCLRGTRANPAFGMGFWNNRAAGPSAREFDIEDMLERNWWKQDWHRSCLCREAPVDTFVSVGSGYQRLIVIPSMELIVVRLGEDAKFSDGKFLRILLGRQATAEPRSEKVTIDLSFCQFLTISFSIFLFRIKDEAMLERG